MICGQKLEQNDISELLIEISALIECECWLKYNKIVQKMYVERNFLIS